MGVSENHVIMDVIKMDTIPAISIRMITCWNSLQNSELTGCDFDNYKKFEAIVVKVISQEDDTYDQLINYSTW